MECPGVLVPINTGQQEMSDPMVGFHYFLGGVNRRNGGKYRKGRGIICYLTAQTNAAGSLGESSNGHKYLPTWQILITPTKE